jgi:YHS domain-containing protein
MRFFVFALAIGAAHLFTVASAKEPSPQEEAKRDQIHIAVQEVCPVSGEKLGEHGAPIKTKVGEETVFLCCKGCLQEKVSPDHWATIHANFAKAQRICPVMKKELPKNAKWTIIEGRIVYVCCPPCTKKVAAAPERFLRQIDELYTASLNARRGSQ